MKQGIAVSAPPSGSLRTKQYHPVLRVTVKLPNEHLLPTSTNGRVQFVLTNEADVLEVHRWLPRPPIIAGRPSPRPLTADCSAAELPGRVSIVFFICGTFSNPLSNIITAIKKWLHSMPSAYSLFVTCHVVVNIQPSDLTTWSI